MRNRDVAPLRLRNQRLSGPPLASAVEVVGWLGAVQAQELAVVPVGLLPFLHAVVLDGQVVGHWRRAPGDPATIELQLRRALNPSERRALEAELSRYGRFLGVTARLTPSAARGSGRSARRAAPARGRP